METQTVFVVDDDEDSLFLLGELLETEGLHPRLFRRAEDAARALAASVEPPRLLLLDNMMPGTPGAALLHTLRNDARWARIPAIVFTAWNDVATPPGLGIPVIPKPHVHALLSGIAAAGCGRSRASASVSPRAQ